MTNPASTNPGTTAFINGDIYNTNDPFATAITVSAATVAFIGESDAVNPANVDSVEELNGDFIAPGFANARADVSGVAADAESELTASARRNGVAQLSLIVSADAIGTPLSSEQAGSPVAVTRYAKARAGEAIDLVAAVAQSDVVTGIAVEEGRTEELAALFDAATAAAVPVFVSAESQSQVDAFVTAATASLESQGGSFQATGHRLFAAVDLGSRAADLTALGVLVTVDPVATPMDLATIVATGVPLSFAFPANESPWISVRAAIFGQHAEQGVSARAAFTAATRGGWRAVGEMDSGILRMGAPATFNRWQVERLVVQTANAGLAAWSTDPRSGTPGLPDLHPEAQFPALVSARIDGEIVADSAHPGG